jgi:ORF6N domain
MSKEIIPIKRVAQSIRRIRSQKVLLDSDLGALYGVQTKNLNKAVKRNAERFPKDFMFQLTSDELRSLRFQIGTSMGRGGLRYPPYAFTEQRVGKHDEEIAAILGAIRRLMAPPDKPGREIGFHVRETAPRYRVRKRG